MTLLEKWRKAAYNEQEDSQKLKELWDDYFKKEKSIYDLGLPEQQNWFDSSDERQGISYNYEADGFNTLKEW